MSADAPPALYEAIRRIRQDATIGPVVRLLEAWMHSPHRDPDYALARLLRPLEGLPAGDSETYRATSAEKPSAPGVVA